MNSLIELFSVMNIIYAVSGAVFFGGVGIAMFAFAISYISQKSAMWIDVMKIVKHRNTLLEESEALKKQVEVFESMINDSGEDQLVAPTEIGVQSILPGPPRLVE